MKHIAILQKEVAVVHKGEGRQTKSSSCRYSKCPSRKHLVELIVDVRMTDDVTARISHKQSFNDVEFFVVVLVETIRQRPVRMPAQDFQQLLVASFTYRPTELAYLVHRLRQDLKLNGVFGRMFHERVAGLKLELARDFADSHSDGAAKPPAGSEDRVHRHRYLQPWFDSAFRENEIRLQCVGKIILHDFERAFRLRVVK